MSVFLVGLPPGRQEFVIDALDLFHCLGAGGEEGAIGKISLVNG